LLFQTLDEKQECVAVYCNDQLIWNEIPQNISKTWKYSAFLKDRDDIEYASLYCGGKSLDDVCPEHLAGQWKKVSDKLKAFYRSFIEARVNLNDNCFFELVPQNFLLEYCSMKNKITEHVLENHEKPSNYDFLLDLTKLVTDIRYNHLNLDLNDLMSHAHEYKTRQFYKKVKSIDPYVKYNVFGTKTGRLTTEKNSFPVLTMDKNYRSIVKPQNDWFVELDFNAAELRVLLALSGKQQPKEDMHDWNVSSVYRGLLTREEAKKRIFAWLYNPYSNDFLSNRAYDRGGVKERHWDGKTVKTPFGREIEADEYHALNYTVQSTTSDLILRQAIKVDKLLSGMKTNISFLVHDSIVLDFAEEDKSTISDIYQTFANTEFGWFKTNVSAGKNFGDLKKLWIQS